MTKKTCTLLLACALLLTQFSNAVYSQELPAGGLCEHHPSHTKDCGFVPAVEGQPCNHTHTPDCYGETPICGNADHEHTPDCYPLECTHEQDGHDGECGYLDAVEAAACGYVCQVCSQQQQETDGAPLVQNNALPADTVTDGGSGPQPSDGGYDPSDVELFQAFLDANPAVKNLEGVNRDNPASWSDLVGWTEGTEGNKKIITALNLQNKGLTGSLNLRSLENLTSLQKLDCSNNQLMHLLWLEKLTNLQTLNCSNNQIKYLDAVGSELEALNCSNNPFTSFKPSKNVSTLSVNWASGGNVIMTGYVHNTRTVELTAVPYKGYVFAGWKELPSNATRTGNKVSFTLNTAATVEATFQSNDGTGQTTTPPSNTGSSSNTGDSGSTAGSILSPTTPTYGSSTPPTTLPSVDLPVTVGKDQTLAGNVELKDILAAIRKNALNNGKQPNGVAIQFDATSSQPYNECAITLDPSALKRLTKKGSNIREFTINTGFAGMTFDQAAMRTMAATGTNGVALTAKKSTANLTGAAQAAVGNRPVCQLAATYTGKDGKKAAITSFGTGSVTVAVPYKPAANEKTTNLALVQSSDGSSANYLPTTYNQASGTLTAQTSSLGYIGVSYRTAPAQNISGTDK